MIKGLSKKEVKIRVKEGKVNYDTTTPSKSIKQIIFENTFTLFNFINVVLAAAIILVGSYKNLLFLGVVICNTLISVVQELRAKKIVDKLSIISSSKAKVIRDGITKEIHIDDIVLDDVIIYELGNQIVVDSVIMDGECEVNESFITGEAKTIYKKKGDTILSGSFIVSGDVKAKVIHVGLDNYTSIISRDAKKMKKQINSEIMKSLNKIVKYISIFLVPIGVLLLLRQFSISGNTTSNAVTSVVAAVIGMIPEGLILLVSTVLAVSTLRLSKKNVLVQDLYCIETLARVDTLCLDKTGTITEGVMEVKDVIPLNKKKINDIDEVLEAISSNLNDNNPTFKALNDKYKNDSKIRINKKIPFSSSRKYSGIVIDNNAYIIGAPEIVLKNYSNYKKNIEKLSCDNRVLALVKTNYNKEINFNNSSEMALILIKDKVRKEAVNTLEYFKNNDVDIKIISGDSASTVKTIAKEVGIDVIGCYDARKLNEASDINTIVKENNIFTRVRPEQKRMIIKALKENGHTVCMTGDGVNDVLALKEADCAVAMNSGSDAARNVSELVLLDSNFDSMPKIVEEGRRTINNVERSAALFLSKTIYASFLAIIFLFIKSPYPFIPIQMSLINSLTIGIPSFILALEPNHDRIKGHFLLNVVKNAFPASFTCVIAVPALVIVSSILKLPFEQISTIAVFLVVYIGMLLIYKISKPLNKLRAALLVVLTLMFLLVYGVDLLKRLYSLVWLTPNSYLILLIFILIIRRLFILFDDLTYLFVKKKKKWFV